MGDISAFVFIPKRNQTFQEIIVLFPTIVSHILISILLTHLCQQFPSIGINSIDTNILYNKVCQEWFFGRVFLRFDDFSCFPAVKKFIGKL